MDGAVYFDVLIIGSGAAGLTLALHLADRARIAVLTKGPLQESATFYAQGGISAVLDTMDSIESHVEDTLAAGAGLCRRAIVQHIVERGRESIQWLIDLGVPFTRATEASSTTEFHLTREGGHSHRRVVHAADATGQAVETALLDRVRAHPEITLFDQHIAIDLLTGAKLGLPSQRCLGAYVLDRKNCRVVTFGASFVVLASGGAGKVYLYTSNPDVATGDGIAMAWRAGCPIANMEFIQFHPTCLYHPKAKSFLLTEAIRGEGGRLLLPDGSTFMERFDPRAELAPRDIVARAIDHEMKRLGADCLYLDISHRPADFILSHFPMVSAKCCPLYLRWCSDRSSWMYRYPRPLCHRRGRLHRPARGQSHGQQFAARVPGHGQSRRSGHPCFLDGGSGRTRATPLGRESGDRLRRRGGGCP